MKRWSSLTDKKEELEKRVKRLEKQLKQQQTQQHEYNHSSDEPKEYSRRSFLKTMAGGAAGLGAAAMIGNASAFRINSNQGLKYYNSSTAEKSQFNVSPDGVLDVNQVGTTNNPISSIYSHTTNTNESFVTHLGAENGHSSFRSSLNTNQQSARRQGALVVMYDDGNVGEYERAFQVHKKHGVPGNTAAITSFLDEDGFLSTDQLHEMVASDIGWGVASHGRYSTRYTTTILDGAHSKGATTLSVTDLKGAFQIDQEGNVPDYTYYIGDYNSGTREKITLVDLDYSNNTITIENGLQYNHDNADIIQHTQDTIARDLGGCIDDLRKIGVGTPSVHVWSGNATGNAAGRAVASRFFDAARSDHGSDVGIDGLNDSPLDRYSLSATGMGSTDGAWLQKIADGNLLGITYMHMNDNIQAEENQIDAFLSDATSLDLDILTIDEAIARFTGSTQRRQQQRAPENNLRLWLPMVEGTGATVRDASGFNNDANWNGTPVYTTGQLGRAAQLTAGTNTITVPNSSTIVPGTDDYSVVMEFETRDTKTGKLIDFHDSGSGGFYIDYSSSGQIRMYFDDSNNGTIFSQDLWLSGDNDTIQVAFIRDTAAGELRLWLNTSRDRGGFKTDDPTGDVNPNIDMEIGAGNSFDLYNLQIFNRVIEREELMSWDLQTLPSGIHEGSFRAFDAGFSDSIELDPTNDGIIVTDQSDGNRYRVVVENGTLTTQGPL